MKPKPILAALFGIAFAAASAAGAAAQSSAPGTPSTKPNRATTAPPPPGGPDKLSTRTHPPAPGAGLRAARPPNVVDDLAGGPNQAHADLPPGPGTYHCASNNACTWLATKCDKAGGGMSQNPPDSPGGFPTQTCTIN